MMYTEDLYIEDLYTEDLYTEDLYTEDMYTEDLYTEDLYTEDMYTEDMYTEDLYIVVFTVKQPLNRTFSTQKSPLYQTWPVVQKYLLLYKLELYVQC